MLKKGVFVFGSGGHATSILSNLLSDGYAILGVIDEFSEKRDLLGIPILNSLPDNLPPSQFVVAIGDNSIRHKVSKRILNIYGTDSLITYISSKSMVSNFVEIQDGCVILANAYIGPGVVISHGALVNTAAVIEHGSRIDEWASVAPSVTLAGEVVIGAFSHVGLSSVVESKVRIGTNAVLGSHSFLREDLGNNLVAFGNPAKIIRSREMGEKYLS